MNQPTKWQVKQLQVKIILQFIVLDGVTQLIVHSKKRKNVMKRNGKMSKIPIKLKVPFISTIKCIYIYYLKISENSGSIAVFNERSTTLFSCTYTNLYIDFLSFQYCMFVFYFFKFSLCKLKEPYAKSFFLFCHGKLSRGIHVSCTL